MNSYCNDVIENLFWVLQIKILRNQDFIATMSKFPLCSKPLQQSSY